MNKQPFYHSAGILFTATHEVTRDELTEALQKLKFKGLVLHTMECEEISAEPGDPADLVG